MATSPSRENGTGPGGPLPHEGKEMQERFERYRTRDAFQPKDRIMMKLGIALSGLLGLILSLILWIDAKLLPGLRFLPIGLVLYCLASMLRLWIVCEWMIWRSCIRGLDFVERGTLQIKRSEEVEKIKNNLKGKRNRPRKRIVCCSGNGGGGHEATMKGLRDLLAEVDFPADLVDVPLAWLVETHRHNPLYTVFNITGEQIYNWGLLHGTFLSWLITWLTSYAQYIALRADWIAGVMAQAIGISWYGDESAKLSCTVWQRYQPDMILDFTTGTHAFMFRGLKRAGLLHVPMVVCISDFEGRGVHGWIENKMQYAVCGTSLCRQHALEFGLPSKQVYQTSGMILRPNFYEDQVIVSSHRGAALTELGLDPAVRTVLVCWGGVGSSTVLEVGKAIVKSRRRVNIIFLCGRNNELAQRLKQIDWPCKVLIQGFTGRVAYFMQLSDMCVCKPGPGVASEAALLGLPMIVEWSAFTLPQEVAVCRWIISRGLGLGFSRMAQLTQRVDRLGELLGGDELKYLGPKPIQSEGQGLSGVDISPALNRAVFEVPEIILDVMDNHDFTPFHLRGKKE